MIGWRIAGLTAVGVGAALAAPIAMAQRAPVPVTVSAAQADGYTRLSFQFPSGRGAVTAVQRDDRLQITLSGGADADISELRSTPPRFVRVIARERGANGQTVIVVDLQAGVKIRQFTDGGASVIDLLAPPSGPPQAPVLVGPVQITEGREFTEIRVNWSAPVAAAIFQRGETAWMVFDQIGVLDVRAGRRAGRRHGAITTPPVEAGSALRIGLSAEMRVSARAEAGAWIVRIAPEGAPRSAPTPASVRRELGPDGKGRLSIAFGRDGAVRRVRDPVLGEEFIVGLLPGEAIGVDGQRSTPEAVIVPTAHGALITPRAGEVTARFESGAMMIHSGARPTTPVSVAYVPREASLGAKSRLSFADHENVPKDLVLDRRAELERRAALEGMGRGASARARLELARFLIAHELAAEALGALQVASLNQPQLAYDPSFRLMRGIASAMMGRMKAAEADLSASGLAEDPLAALWRGEAALGNGAWEAAQRNFERGRDLLATLGRSMRSRFLTSLARAAIENRDFSAAKAASDAAEAESTNALESERARLMRAIVVRESGDVRAALDMFNVLTDSSDARIAAVAALESVRSRRALSEMSAEDAANAMEALRFRWRGDDFELAVNQSLGALYVKIGRWRDGLDVMRAAATRFPNHPTGRQMRGDMGAIFESLFLDGEADQLDPIQALGLFYDFQDLTPVGPNGDRMVRALAGRLVKLDLLEQAGQLLKYQIDQRLDGLAKAQIAADLAVIYLQDGKAEQALNILASTRQPRMPPQILAERRILEAKAQLELGRAGIALELIERDRSIEAQRLRADIAWRSQDWAKATAEMRALASLLPKEGALDDADRAIVMRAGVAAVLSGDKPAREAIRREFAARMVGTIDADAFELLTGELELDGVTIRNLAERIAGKDLLDRFMQGMRDRLAAGAPAASPAPARPPS
jgi:tetratricopeptide (TPR) repeat protein